MCRLPWHFQIGKQRGGQRTPANDTPPSYRTELTVDSIALREEDEEISFRPRPNARSQAPSSLGAKGVAEPPQRKRGRATADIDDEDSTKSTGARRVRPRLEKWNDTPSTDGPGVPLANHSRPQPFTTLPVTQESTTGDVHSSSDTPTPSPHPVQKQQSSDRPAESIRTVLRATNPCMGPVSGGIEIWLSVHDLPMTSTLYARFGTQVTATVSSIFHPFITHLISMLGCSGPKYAVVSTSLRKSCWSCEGYTIPFGLSWGSRVWDEHC